MTAMPLHRYVHTAAVTALAGAAVTHPSVLTLTALLTSAAVTAAATRRSHR